MTGFKASKHYDYDDCLMLYDLEDDDAAALLVFDDETKAEDVIGLLEEFVSYLKGEENDE